MNQLIRTIHPEIRVVDQARGIVDYVASDETVDSYNEVIKAKGWRFTNFKNNPQLLDSHTYGSIAASLGKVIEFGVKAGQLVERAKFAIEKEIGNAMAQLAFGMVSGGYLPAVSVGFFPVASVNSYGMDGKAWKETCKENNVEDYENVRTIFTQQEQCELSVCVIGANPNALLKAKSDGVLRDEDMLTLGFRDDDSLETLSLIAAEYDGLDSNGHRLAQLMIRTICGRKISQKETQQLDPSAIAPDGADESRRREQHAAFIEKLRSIGKR